MSINFLLQSARIIHNGNYTDTELRMIYDYLKDLDKHDLISYFGSNIVLNYNNDLDFCIEILEHMIKILEKEEEYEKCQVLFNKKNESIKIKFYNFENHEN